MSKMDYFIFFPPVRVQKYEKGYAVEMQKKTWYGRKYWVHVICGMGKQESPFYYEDFEQATEAAKRFFLWDLMIHSE